VMRQGPLLVRFVLPGDSGKPARNVHLGSIGRVVMMARPMLRNAFSAPVAFTKIRKARLLVFLVRLGKPMPSQEAKTVRCVSRNILATKQNWFTVTSALSASVLYEEVRPAA